MFDSIVIKRCHDACLSNFTDEHENGPPLMKHRSQEIKIEKPCKHSSGYCFDANIPEISLKV
jgi:hypothetical protein